MSKVIEETDDMTSSSMGRIGRGGPGNDALKKLDLIEGGFSIPGSRFDNF